MLSKRGSVSTSSLIIRSFNINKKKFASSLSNFQTEAILRKTVYDDTTKLLNQLNGGKSFEYVSLRNPGQIQHPQATTDFFNPSFSQQNSLMKALKLKSKNNNGNNEVKIDSSDKENNKNDNNGKDEKTNDDDQRNNDKEDETDKQPPAPSKDTPKSSVRGSFKSSKPPGSGAAAAAAGGAAPPGNNDGGDGNSSAPSFSAKSSSKSAKQDISTDLPEVYPQILALPISGRPLFPGFYKCVVITDVNVMKAIKEMMNKNQPYIGCFLFKNENAEGDTIKSKDEVYETGVLAQVTSTVFSRDVETGNEILTTVFYVHKRIKIDELFAPKEVKDYEQDTSAAHDQPEEIVVRSQKEKKEIIDGITGEKEGDTPSSTERNRIVDADEEKQISPQTKPMITKQDVDAAIEDEQENPTAYLKKYPITLVNVSNVEDLPYDKKSPMINALTAEILQVFKDISSMNKVFSDQMATFSSSLQKDVFQSPEKLADFAASLSAAEEKDLQEILECVDVEKRLELALVVLNKELMNKKLQKDIEKDLEERMTKRHREYHLNEQLKSIKKELGIDDGRDKLIAKYNERVKDLKMPEDVKKVYDDEINKLSSLEPLMSEFTVTRNYLDWLTQIPWGKASKDEYSIRRAVRILNEDHYGLKDVKERILEFIAVGKLLNKINGKIICFVGPPGVGKTSIGKSIAEALNRKFYRFSVGGLSDVSEIKGHRRTYVGAIPGRVVQALKKTQTENPLILIDEIDKVSHTHSVNGGDPAAALLELLDPEQNNSFLDNYMDVPIDLSKVLFVCTANTLSTIPGPLLDRMEVIEISGYIAEEKIKIAEKYLAPDAKKSSGLDKVNVNLTEEAIKALIKNYCRESGVRNLKKQIEKIYRKAALNVVKELGDEEVDVVKDEELLEKSDEEHKKDNNEISTSETEPKDTTKTKTASKNSEETHDEKQARNLDTTPKPEDEVEAEIPQINVPESYKVEVDEKNLKDYVGPQIYTADRLYETTPPGVVMGLAWTSMGGSALYIESVLEQAITIDSVPRVEITGQLGDVMKESSRIAYSFAEMFLAKNYPGNRFFEKAKIHLHCPEGATPKDGPSAGVTMTSSFLSLALNKSLDPTVAMTGELTLTGKVLRIGGLKEKTIAAKRSGVKTIIFPKDNLADWKELPDNVKEGLTPVAADWYSDVFNVLFPDLSKEDANNVWKAEFDKIEEEKNKKNDNK